MAWNFQLIMNAKPDSIDQVPGLHSGLCIHRTVTYDVLFNRKRIQRTPRVLKARAELILILGDDRTTQFGETLSYATLWLCGLLSIVLCFL